MYIHVGTSITTDDLSSKYIKTKSFCSLCIQTLESHLVDNTKVYVELQQRYYKMLDQKEEQVRGSLPAVYNYIKLYWLTHTTPTQVQSVEDTAGKNEKENEQEKQQADEYKIEEKDEDITDRVLVEDGEKSNKDWGYDMIWWSLD